MAVHRDSAFYDLASFRAGRSSLRPRDVAEVGPVDGRSLLHLQCHFGQDTLSWARLGARATGADFSETAIELARSLADELHVDARFVCANLYDLPEALDERFDIVFTSYGVLGWLPDLAGWARVVAHFLEPGGIFYLAEIHPVGAVFDEEDGRLEPNWPMFHEGPWEETATQTYADLSVELPAAVQYDFPFTVGDAVTALVEAGLTIESLHELPYGVWPRFPSMAQDAEGWWRLPGDPLPLLVSVRASKPR